MNTTYGTPNRKHKMTFGYVGAGNNIRTSRCLSKVTITAWLVLVMMLRLVLRQLGQEYQNRFTNWQKSEGAADRQEGAPHRQPLWIPRRCLEPHMVQRLPKWLQKWSRNQNKCKPTIAWKMDTDVYWFGRRCLASCYRNTEPKCEKNW